MIRAVLLAALALAGCAFQPEKLLADDTKIEVREVGRSLYCNSEDEAPAALLLPDAKSVLDWQAARGVTLAGIAVLPQTAYAVVEMGARPTGGYGLAIARGAVLRGDLVILSATFVSPAPGSIRTQALSSPCALVQLPPGRYRTVEVLDQTGEVRARGGLPGTAPAAVPPAGSTPEPPGMPVPDEPPPDAA